MRLRGVQKGVGACDIELRAASSFEGGFGNAQGFALIAGVFLRDVELSLGTAELEVVDGDLGLERDENVLRVGLGCGAGGLGGFHAVTDASEEVELVVSIETGAPGINGAATKGGVHGGTELRGFVAATSGDGGREVELRLSPQGSCFKQSRFGDGEVFVLLGGLSDEAVQRAVVELAPPGG